jgi:hypothetical protein
MTTSTPPHEIANVRTKYVATGWRMMHALRAVMMPTLRAAFAT